MKMKRKKKQPIRRLWVHKMWIEIEAEIPGLEASKAIVPVNLMTGRYLWQGDSLEIFFDELIEEFGKPDNSDALAKTRAEYP